MFRVGDVVTTTTIGKQAGKIIFEATSCTSSSYLLTALISRPAPPALSLLWSRESRRTLTRVSKVIVWAMSSLQECGSD